MQTVKLSSILIVVRSEELPLACLREHVLDAQLLSLQISTGVYIMQNKPPVIFVLFSKNIQTRTITETSLLFITVCCSLIQGYMQNTKVGGDIK